MARREDARAYRRAARPPAGCVDTREHRRLDVDRGVKLKGGGGQDVHAVKGERVVLLLCDHARVLAQVHGLVRAHYRLHELASLLIPFPVRYLVLIVGALQRSLLLAGLAHQTDGNCVEHWVADV